MPGETSEEWRRLEALIDRVLDAPTSDRAALIAEITGGDPARQAELAQLLAECDRGFPLLEQPATDRFASLLEPGSAFPAGLTDRYRPIRELGRGGMATVYLARDEKHGRDVAVKIMRPDLAAALGRDRFLREIGLAAQLRHPNIVPLFDSGEVDGFLFYVMPYEAGRSLRERLREDRRLPVAETIRILRDVCDALSYAHQRGVVHRDIKPDNILLAGRHALVSDFGVARAITPAADESVTTQGGALGTPAYMAPERAAGEGQDRRIDIYALGVTGFEMLAGERPFGSDSPLPRDATVEQLRDRLLHLRPELTAPLAEILARCLAPLPEQRHPDCDAVLAALDQTEQPARVAATPGPPLRPWLVAAALVAAVVVAALAWNRWTARRASAGAPAIPRLAVLVFQHGGAPDLEPLAMGLTDNLIGALGGVPGLEVRSLSAVLPYRDSVTAPDVLGRRLDVTWLVGGRLYQVGERRTASVQLTEARTGRLIARTETAAGPGEDLRLIEATVTQVASMLRERLGEELRIRDWRAGTRSDAAFAAVNRAHQERVEASRLAELRDIPGALLRLKRAEATLDSAARADPRWAEPWIQRAAVSRYTAEMLFGSGYVPDSVPAVLAAGIGYAERALRIDSTSSRAREALGILWFESGNHTVNPDSAARARATAERILREVSEADTTLADALATLGALHFDRGEFEQAYVAAERAWRADAWHRDPQETLGRLFIYGFEAEEDVEAERWCLQYGARFTDDWFGGFCRLMLMTWGTGAAAPADSALAIASRAEAQAPRVIRPVVSAQLRTLAAGALARAGRNGEAQQVLSEVRNAVAANPQAAREPFGTELLEIEAGVRLRLGERDTAGALLRELLRRQPERAIRLTASRRFRELAIAVPPRTAR